MREAWYDYREEVRKARSIRDDAFAASQSRADRIDSLDSYFAQSKGLERHELEREAVTEWSDQRGFLATQYNKAYHAVLGITGNSGETLWPIVGAVHSANKAAWQAFDDAHREWIRVQQLYEDARFDAMGSVDLDTLLSVIDLRRSAEDAAARVDFKYKIGWYSIEYNTAWASAAANSRGCW